MHINKSVIIIRNNLLSMLFRVHLTHLRVDKRFFEKIPRAVCGSKMVPASTVCVRVSPTAVTVRVFYIFFSYIFTVCLTHSKCLYIYYTESAYVGVGLRLCLCEYLANVLT